MTVSSLGPGMPAAVQPVALILLSWMASTICTGQGVTWPPPPLWIHKAQMARYLIHNADWGIVSAISPEIGLQPFGTVQSFSDGTKNNSTGTPYFYIASISDTGKNIKYNNTVSLSVSQAMSDYCSKELIDPEEPICARVTVTGQMVRVSETEVPFARATVFTRHPAMKNWPKGHDWKFYKLNLTGVYLLDFYGGCTHVALKDYYKATPFGKKPTKRNPANNLKGQQKYSIVPGKVTEN